MPTVLWACPLIQVGEISMPRVVQILDTIAPHVTSWSTTPGNRAAPYAVGSSTVTDAQLTALEAENTVHTLTEERWQLQFGDLPAAIRNRVNQFCTNVGVARPTTNEVIRDLFTRMTTILDNKNIDDHISRSRG